MVLTRVMVLTVSPCYGVSLCYGVCCGMVLTCVMVLALLWCWLCYGVCPCYGVNLCYGVSHVMFPWLGSHGLSARRAQRTMSRGPKGFQLEDRARRAP